MAKTTTDAIAILRKRLGDSPELDQMIVEDKVNVRVAMMIYEARTKADLSQQDLADLVGTSQQAISRLENADYDGHSVSMLQRIGEALNKRIEIRLV